MKIASNMSLPLSFVTQTQAILAKRGVGKSYTASVQAEEMLKANQQIIVIDVTGAWHGLRSSADGKSKGFPILIAGGEHGDIPLEKNAGEIIAGAITKERFSCILDISLFRKGEATQFLGDFLSNLYRLNREPVHLFADEADFYAPQKPFGLEAVTLGAMDDVVRRGRAKGIGTTLITQRPAVLNKNVLTQCEVLTTLRLVHPKDISAIKEWIDVHGDTELAKEMIKSLPSLPVGTCWMWAPGWPTEQGIFKQVQIRKRETFDSGATPKAGEQKKFPKVLANVEVDKLGESIKATAESAKDNDPKALKMKIAQLQSELSKKIEPQEKIEIIEVPVIQDKQISELKSLAEKINSSFNNLNETLLEVKNHQPTTFLLKKELKVSSKPISRAEKEPSILGKGEMVILTAIAQHSDGVTREQLTVLTGYKRSSRDAYVQRLAQKKLIEIAGTEIYATNDGIAELGENFEALPTGSDLRNYWLKKLPEGERKVLEVVVAHYPSSISREQVSELTDYKRSSRDAYVQRLSARKLVLPLGREGVIASKLLF